MISAWQWKCEMRTLDFLPRQRWIDRLRDWLYLEPSAIEIARRYEIMKIYGSYPPVRMRAPKPPPSPPPPAKRRDDV